MLTYITAIGPTDRISKLVLTWYRQLLGLFWTPQFFVCLFVSRNVLFCSCFCFTHCHLVYHVIEALLYVMFPLCLSWLGHIWREYRSVVLFTKSVPLFMCCLLSPDRFVVGSLGSKHPRNDMPFLVHRQQHVTSHVLLLDTTSFALIWLRLLIVSRYP